ncbi:transglycosylase SLT domain-containing protein [Nonomuraea sp. 3N208]|uniref:transglycosylase SLT domain-containing protein n=1 Tax=Nonomuraea sp. 3N208 TaxID=3457421 RepID=UPI003FCCD80C
MSIVSTLAGLKDKVDGDPAAIRGIASSLRTMGGHVSSSANQLTKSVSEVGNAWGGDSADAFTSYMAAYPKAGEDLDGALTSCASALDTAATKLETAYSTVSGLHASASSLASDYQRNHDDATQDDIDRYVTETLGDPVGDANDAVAAAETALTTAKNALDGQLGEDGFTFFKDIRQPGGADFQPGDNPVDWQRIAGYTPTTTLASADGGAGGGGGGVGAPSSYGNAPAPKGQVVDWIKQALTIIKSPEMAAIMRQRGLDVSDLDPNDPKAIQRIWTVIYHESGGNPNAINNWDINAKNGVPSQGLMQTIPPTFNAHALPGYGGIREPVDNIIAGVLYTYSRYGNLAGHPGISSLESGGGYRPY